MLGIPQIICAIDELVGDFLYFVNVLVKHDSGCGQIPRARGDFEPEIISRCWSSLLDDRWDKCSWYVASMGVIVRRREVPINPTPLVLIVMRPMF